MDVIRVLILEDDRYIQEVVRAQLEKSKIWKFQMTFIEYMEEALKLKDTGLFDIFLADLELPDSTKDSTLRILKNEFRQIPFVILTGHDDDSLLLQSLEAGASDYLSKEYLSQGALLSRTLFNALEHWKILQELEYTATHDTLTGAVNKSHFMKILKGKIEMAAYDDKPFCLAMCDLDDFRNINNSYGHMTGDRALILFVETVMERIRTKDTMGRFGGDEFCLIFPDTEKEKCRRYLNKLTSLKIELPGMIPVKGSYGGAQFHKGMSAEELIITADKALYQVKSEGKGFSRVL
ncbi:GGDEF domain-containing response regulator [Spirochaeta isovalerica]|uniref:diguanylate cyclase n=1 Tax=Spirochaeta isovalerica TaxID=150 RepID=A0A841R9Y2_9SPIO|nr:diguanylate cyclase response regulator [Spirochaeta isovalerica]MBB6480171.1 diguanylate cyclase (GGDEF)-like protein [Spirochaeta isovalerica]